MTSMGIITEITRQKRNRERYNVYMDGEFLCGIDAESLVRNRLQTGMEADGEQIRRAIFESDAKEAFERGADLLSHGRKTEREMRDYFARRGYSEEVAEFVLAKLKHYGYVDDESFLEAYLSGRAAGMGRYRIRTELARRGIPEEKIRERLESFREDPEEMADLARRFLRGKVLDRKTGAALYRHLLSKGFEAEGVGETVRKVFAEAEGEDRDGQDL